MTIDFDKNWDRVIWQDQRPGGLAICFAPWFDLADNLFVSKSHFIYKHKTYLIEKINDLDGKNGNKDFLVLTENPLKRPKKFDYALDILEF